MFHSTYYSSMELYITCRPIVNAKVLFNCLAMIINFIKQSLKIQEAVQIFKNHYHNVSKNVELSCSSSQRKSTDVLGTNSLTLVHYI